MRVKVLIVLAIASVLLLCSSGVAMAGIVPVTQVDGTKVAQVLQQQAMDAGAADSFGFPVLDNINGETIAADADQQSADQINSIDACPLNTLNCNGDCGECPDCTVQDTLTTFAGPEVNLACPVVNTVAAPVELESPVINPAFPTINLAPQATIEIPAPDVKLNCFNIDCQGCGCPTTSSLW